MIQPNIDTVQELLAHALMLSFHDATVYLVSISMSHWPN